MADAQPPRVPQPVDGDSELRCAEFSRSWNEGRRPSIEDFLENSNLPDGPPQGNLLVRLILCEVNLRRQSGEAPCADEYARRFPMLEREDLDDVLSLPALPVPQEPAPLFPSRYEALAEIGRGGIGSVWRIRDRQLNRVIAAKVLVNRFHHDGGANLRLQRECQLTGSLQHPGIPPVHDRGELLSGSSFFTMKLVEGETLATLLRRRTGTSEERLRFLQVFRQVAETLAFAHAQQVIHRDVKPDNVMVGEFGEVQLMDWGLARGVVDSIIPTKDSAASPSQPPVETRSIERRSNSTQAIAGSAESGLTVFGDVLGTPAYMPPEQARGDLGALSARSDVFSLGAMLFEILTGRRLYEQQREKPLDDASATSRLRDSVAQLDDCDVDDELRDLCRHCLQFDPNDRPASAQEVAQAISHYLTSVEARLRQAELDRTATEVARLEGAKRQRIKLVFAAAAMLTLGIASCAAVWYQFDRARQEQASQQRRADSLVRALLTSPRESLPSAIANVASVREYSLPLLREEFEQFYDERSRLRAAIALGLMGKGNEPFLVDSIATAESEDLPLLVEALRTDSSSTGPEVVRRWEFNSDLTVKTRLAAVALMLGETGPARQMFGDRSQANPRMALIDFFTRWQGEIDPLFQFHQEADSSVVCYAVLASIASVPAEHVRVEDQEQWATRLIDLYVRSPDASQRSTAELILRRWGRELPRLEPQQPSDGTAGHYTNSIGMRLIRLTLRELTPNDRHRSLPERSVYVSDRETTAAQFLQFLDERPDITNRVCRSEGASWIFRPTLEWSLESDHENIPWDQLALERVPPTDAALFCNWLSEREGLKPYYVDLETEDARKTYGMQLHEQWDRDVDADGYRLPNKLEFLAMIGSAEALPAVDALESGNEEFRSQYAWCYLNTRGSRAVATRLPNLRGLFDTYGNVSEMGDEWTTVYADDQSPRLRYWIYGTSYEDAVDWQMTRSTAGLRKDHWGAGRRATGFRVVRTPSRSLQHRKDWLESENREQTARNTMALLRRQAERASSDAQLLAVTQRQMDYGLSKLDQRQYEEAAESFGDAQWNLRQLIARDFETTRCQTYLGGTLVNRAIVLRSLGRLEAALAELDEAQIQLNEVLANSPDEKLAQRFLVNSRLVLFDTLVPYAIEKARYPNDDWQAERPALQAALEALALSDDPLLRVSDDERLRLYDALAIGYAALGRFELAIGWGQRAVETAAPRLQPFYQERLDRLKRGESLSR